MYGIGNLKLSGTQELIGGENKFPEPIFTSRAVTTELSLYPGASVSIGGLTRETITLSKDGREVRERKILYIVVTLHQCEVLAKGLANVTPHRSAEPFKTD